jgi:hypothetical protein
MTTNRLASPVDRPARIIAPVEPKERERFWIDRGNRVLWGQEPTSKGDFLPSRTDLQWACANGSYFIEPRR